MQQFWGVLLVGLTLSVHEEVAHSTYQWITRASIILVLVVVYLLSRFFLLKLRSQRDFEIFVESLPIQIWTATPEGEVDYVGRKLEAFAGKSKKAILADWLGLLHPDDREKTVEAWTHSVATLTPYNVQFRLRSADGRYIWHLTEGVPDFDKEGRCLRWLGSSIDINDLIETQAKLETASIRLGLVAKATNDTIWDWDIEQNKVWWNDNFTKMFGYKVDEIESGPESWFNRIAPEERERVVADIHRALDSNAVNWSLEYRFVHNTGELRHVIDRGFIARNSEGKAIRMVGSMMDITDRVRIEEQLRQTQKLESVGQLTGGIAHDFNNLLTVIIGNAELLERRLSGRDDVAELIRTSLQAANQGSKLVSRLLAFSSHQKLMQEIIDIRQVIQDTEALLLRAINSTIKLELNLPDQPAYCEVDVSQLETALLNLILNARDAIETKGCITVTVTHKALDHFSLDGDVLDGNFIVISVTDNGKGMTAETKRRVLEPFFTTKDKAKGSGLGLSMVYGFVKQSNGFLFIDSKVSVGTSIDIYLPELAPQAEAERVSEEGVRLNKHDKIKRLNVLAVEDDDLVRQSLMNQLDALGCKVTAVESGNRVLTMMNDECCFDLVISDVQMPGSISGIDLAKELERRYPSLPVVLISGYTDDVAIRTVVEKKGRYVLWKPFSLDELKMKIHEAALASPKSREN